MITALVGLVPAVALVGLASSTRPAAAAAGDPVIAVAGDIACPPGATPTAVKCQQAATGNQLNGIAPTVVLPAGDTQYNSGTSAEYVASYDKTGWGAFKPSSRPAAGNHEYLTAGAAGYYGYFGANAGDSTKGYYSYDVTVASAATRWHLVVLNSECAQVGGCGTNSPQEQWLKADLAANRGICTLAYWHRPRFSSSSTTAGSGAFTPFWNDLYAAGADVVLNGHAHDYERFAPQTSSGAADPAKGLTEFVVGTGGEDFARLGAGIANSVVRSNTSFGVLKMTLHASSYDWQFVPVPGATFTDSGTASCHSAAPVDRIQPSTPTGLVATATTANQVSLSWTASTDNVGVKNYNVYRAVSGQPLALLATTTSNATTFTDASVSASTSYSYTVQALDAAGNASAQSTPASITTPAAPDTVPPTAPGALHGEAVTSSEVDLGWTASTDSGTGVSGYRVYRRPTGSATWTRLATTTGAATTYQDLTVTGGTGYDYQVTAIDGAANESSPSNGVTVTTPPAPPSDSLPPTAPANLTASAINSATVGLSWSPSTDNVGVTGYNVYRDGTKIAAVPNTPQSWSDTTVAPATTYSYTLTAVDAAGNESPMSNTAPVTTPPATSAPIALRSATSAANAAASSVTVAAPATVSGDVLIASVDVRGAPTITPPAGWQLIRMDPSGTTMRQASYWHVAGSTEPTSYTWQFSSAQTAVASVLGYSGVSTTSPVNASGGQANASSATAAAPSITTTVANTELVSLFGYAVLTTVTPPTGMTERTDISAPSTVTFKASGETADAAQAAAGATGARTATAGAPGVNIGQLVALTPAG